MARFVTAKEAVTHIKSGDRVVLAHSVGAPQHLANAMVDNCQAYRIVEICHMRALGPCKHCAPGMEQHFWHNSLFSGPGGRRSPVSQEAPDVCLTDTGGFFIPQESYRRALQAAAFPRRSGRRVFSPFFDQQG